MILRPLASALLLTSSVSAAVPRVAVLELRNKLGTVDRSSLDGAYLTDLVRSGLLKASPSIDMMTRENVLVLLQAQGKTLEECEGECEVDTARRLGADLVVSGDLLRFGSAYRISIRLHDTHSSRLLAAAQASGITPDELVAGIPAAMAELAAAIGPVRPAPEPAHSPATWWRQNYLRDAAQLMGGYGYDKVGRTPRLGARAFGLEVRLSTGAHFSETLSGGGTTPTYQHDADWTGWFVGISPLSLSTGTWGEPSAVEFVFFEPSIGYEFGSLHKSENASTVSTTLSGLEVGTRFYLKIALSRSIGICLGAEIAYSTIDWRSVMVPGETGSGFGGGLPLLLAGFGGLSLTLGN